jgi:hypothetical protein
MIDAVALRAHAQERVAGLLATLGPLLEQLERERQLLEAEQPAFDNLYNILDRAHSKFSFGMYADYYTRDIGTPTEPFLIGFGSDPNTDHYAPLDQKHITRIQAQFVDPATEAVRAIFEPAKCALMEIGPKVTVLTRLEGFGAALEQIAGLLQPPWAFAPTADGVGHEGHHVSPGWVVLSGMRPELPIHKRLFVVRRASVNTIYLLRDKFYGIVACLTAVHGEIPFSNPLAKPLPVPKTLIVQNTTIGAGAQIVGSAIGTKSQNTTAVGTDASRPRRA